MDIICFVLYLCCIRGAVLYPQRRNEQCLNATPAIFRLPCLIGLYVCDRQPFNKLITPSTLATFYDAPGAM